MRLVEVDSADEMMAFCQLSQSVPHATRLSAETPSMRQADGHWMVVDEGNGESDRQVLARCSLWWSDVADYPDQKLGYVGHYAALDDGAAEILLTRVCEQLAERGCTLAVGPMDGNTFRHYRFVTENAMADGEGNERIERPPFFLEPINPAAWPQQFVGQGFQPLAHYISAFGKLPEADPRLDTLAERVTAANVMVRTAILDGSEDVFEDELRRIYRVTVASFQDNFLYQPIEEAEFVAQYAAVRDYVRPELVLIAEAQDDHEPVGFLFAVPDLAQAQRGESVDTVILKTAAVLPTYGGSGVGGYLVARCQTDAYALGFRHVIHALMFEDNVSRKISAHYTQTMRRYTLFAKGLSA